MLDSPHLGLDQLAKRVGRCRKRVAKLLSASRLRPRNVEAIIDGIQSTSIN